MTKRINKGKYFLPYQNRWLRDKSKYKVWEKSRRIGATYVQSYEDVTDCVTKTKYDVWFSSADKSAAEEYIRYCEQWAKFLNIAAKMLGKIVIDSKEDIKAYVIEFANGSRIHALSSNPKQFRSKGGKVILDEFAHHDNPLQLWMAAQPCTTWKGKVRILSTHNGQNCKFYEFVDNIQRGELDWALHTTPIQLAVDEGLVDKIYERETTEEERQAWIEEQRKGCHDPFTWQQEFCCIAVDEATAFLPYSLIVSCEADDLEIDLSEVTGDLYVGMDIGRVNHPSVIWVIEKLGKVNYTRLCKPLENTLYRVQEEILFEILKHKRFRKCCIDATGQGDQLAENAVIKFSGSRVEAIKFTASLKENLAYNLRTHFENKTVYIPSDPTIREDLHSVICEVTVSRHIRFDVEKTEAKGHADRFWALALALHAAGSYKPPIHIETRMRRKSFDITRGLCPKVDISKW